MQTIRGNLLALAIAGEFDVIIHGCNCQNTMGAGIAKSIKLQFPAAYEADLATEKGAHDKLGTYSFATADCDGRALIIVNAYPQFNWRGRGIKTDYDAIRSVFAKIKSDFCGKRSFPILLVVGDNDLASDPMQSDLNCYQSAGHDAELIGVRKLGHEWSIRHNADCWSLMSDRRNSDAIFIKSSRQSFY